MDTKSRTNRLQALQEKVNLPGRIEQAGIDYRRKPTQKTLIALLRADPHQHKLVLELAAFLANCNRQNPCLLSICRNCGAGMKRKEVKANTKSLIASIGDRPAQEQLAWITVNYGPIDPLNEEGCQDTAGTFRDSLHNTFSRHLEGYKAVGHMDVSDDMELHAHLLVWAAGMDREYLARQLRGVYRGKRSVCVSEWYELKDHRTPDRERIKNREITLDDLNVVKVVSYGIKVLPEVKMNSDGRLLLGEEVSAVVGRKLLGLQHIKRMGLLGGRIKIGLRKPEWEFKRDLLVHRETGECKTIRIVTELMKKNRNGLLSAYVRGKIVEKQRKALAKELPMAVGKAVRGEMGGSVMLTVAGQELVYPETGEIDSVNGWAAAQVNKRG